jgi:hypothetical protein
MPAPRTIGDDEYRPLARSLRRIEDKYLKDPPAGREHEWFQGAEPYFEVYLERDGEGLAWFQITVRGHSVTYSREKGRVVTGYTRETEVDEAMHPASKIIDEHERLNQDTLRVAIRILEARADLPEFDEPIAKLREVAS